MSKTHRFQSDNDDSSFSDDLAEIERSFDPEPIEVEDDAPDFDGDEADEAIQDDYGDEMDGDHESALESVYGPNDGLFDAYEDDGDY